MLNASGRPWKIQKEWADWAESECHVTEPHGIILADHEAQYLDMITKNVASFYLCRRKSCLHIWRSVDWLKLGGWQFYCPACAERYIAWSMKKTTNVKANLVWITRASSNPPSNMCLTGRNNKKYEVTPTTWPETTINSLTNSLKEVHARLETSIKSLEPHQRMRHVVDLMKASPAQSYLTHFRLPKATLQVTEGWDIEHQRRQGVWGADLRHLNTELFDNPVDQKDILRAFLAAHIIMQTACRTTVASLATDIHAALSEEPRAEEGEEQEV